MKIFLSTILLFICASLFSLNFTSVEIGEAGEDNPGIVSINFDLDEDLDLVVSKNSTDQIILYENTGDWDNPILHIVAEDFDPQYLYAEDMNDDDYPDILASSAIDNLVTIWYTSFIGESLYFTREDVAEGITGAHRVIAKDVNSDGFMDVVCAAAGLGKILWWEKDGSEWIEHQVDDNFPGCQAICVEDMNNDTFPDVIGASMDNDEIAVWYNSGTEIITWQKQQQDTNFAWAHWVSIADINNDDLPDIIGAAYLSDEISWWENDGQTIESWQKNTIANNINGAVTVEPAYLNNDDQVDLIGTSWISCRIYYWIQGEGDFNQSVLAYNQWGAWPIAVGDFDGDNHSDFVVGSDVLGATISSSPLTLWLNDTIVDVEDELINQSDFDLYPNPVKNRLNIKLSNRDLEISKIEIFNIMGQKVAEKECRRNASNISIDLVNQPSLSNGIYILKVSSDKECLLKKFALLK